MEKDHISDLSHACTACTMMHTYYLHTIWYTVFEK